MVTYVKVQRKENGESALNRYHASKQVERTKTCRTHLYIDGDASSAATRARIVLHSTNELITDVQHVDSWSLLRVLSCICFWPHDPICHVCSLLQVDRFFESILLIIVQYRYLK